MRKLASGSKEKWKRSNIAGEWHRITWFERSTRKTQKMNTVFLAMRINGTKLQHSLKRVQYEVFVAIFPNKTTKDTLFGLHHCHGFLPLSPPSQPPDTGIQCSPLSFSRSSILITLTTYYGHRCGILSDSLFYSLPSIGRRYS